MRCFRAAAPPIVRGVGGIARYAPGFVGIQRGTPGRDNLLVVIDFAEARITGPRGQRTPGCS